MAERAAAGKARGLNLSFPAVCGVVCGLLAELVAVLLAGRDARWCRSTAASLGATGARDCLPVNGPGWLRVPTGE